MSDDAFRRMARRLHGTEEPRPEFVASLYDELTRVLGHGTDGQTFSSPAAAVDERTQAVFRPEPVAGRRRRPGWVALVAALAGLVLIGGPLVLSSIDGEQAGRFSVPATEAPIDLTPGRPVGIPVTGDSEAYYMLYLPSGYDGTSPLPLVVALANESGGISGGLGFWGMQRADVQGVALISTAPSARVWTFATTADEAAGLEDPWIGADPPYGSADIELIETLLDDVEQRISVARVFVAGQGHAGLLAGRVACDLADRVDAVAASPSAVYYPSGCSAQTMVPYVALGSRRPQTRDLFSPDRALEELSAWAGHAGCRTRTEHTLETGVIEVAHRDCADGAVYVLDLVGADAAAAWDDPIPVMWRFFDATVDADG